MFIQLSLFPKVPVIDFVSIRQKDDCCPFCKENRVTDQIHGFLTFLCGASRRLNSFTSCEGEKYLGFVEIKND